MLTLGGLLLTNRIHFSANVSLPVEDSFNETLSNSATRQKLKPLSSEKRQTFWFVEILEVLN